VLNGDVVAGSISLSYIDTAAGCARTGYSIAPEFQGRGYGSEALSQLLGIARARNLQRVSGKISEANVASRKIWEKCGAPVEFSQNEITAILSGGS